MVGAGGASVGEAFSLSAVFLEEDFLEEGLENIWTCGD